MAATDDDDVTDGVVELVAEGIMALFTLVEEVGVAVVDGDVVPTLVTAATAIAAACAAAAAVAATNDC